MKDVNMVASEVYTLEELFDVEKQAQTASDRVLHAPEPPGLFHDLVDFTKENIIPCDRGGILTSIKNQPQSKCVISLLRGIFPILCWFQNYDGAKFKNDFIAGLTLASLCIPQAMGYANFAHLEPEYGLYTSVVPPLIYAQIGTSRDIVIGVVAVNSLLLSSMILKLNPSMSFTTYKMLVFTATFFAGVFQAAFGFLRLGFLVDFLSRAATIGFVAGAAIVIGLQQLKGLFGINHVTIHSDIISVIKAVWRSLVENWNPYNFILGCSFLIFILISKFLARRSKKLFSLKTAAPFLSFMLSTIVVLITNSQEHGIEIVRQVKGGLNPSPVDQLQFDGPYARDVAKIGFGLAVVGLLEASTVGRSFASIKGYYLDANKEMVAVGSMSIVGSITSCYVATGKLTGHIGRAIRCTISIHFNPTLERRAPLNTTRKGLINGGF